MPTYTFRTIATNEPVQIVCSMAEYARKYEGREKVTIDGAECVRDFLSDRPGGTPTDAWPIRSSGAGVHPDQIPAARRLAAEQGVAIDFHKDGDAIFTSRSQRKAYLKTRGLHDRDGGYGD